MSLQRLGIFNVRNIQKQTIIPAPTFNFFFGKNGSGKSAILEAIHILGRAKSFRVHHLKSVVAFNQPHLIVTGDILKSQLRTIHMGIKADGSETDIRINHLPNQKVIDLANGLPLQIIHPKSFELLDIGSKIRRDFLDWGIFNHDEDFLSAWRKYKQALLHRNAVLKARSLNQLEIWNNELVNYGTIVNNYRENYLHNLSRIFEVTINNFLTMNNVEMNLVSGWLKGKTLQQTLKDDLDRDLRYGFTHSGPHRGDFQLLINKKLAKDVVSRGQLKLLVLSLKLAQIEFILQEGRRFGCILIDDFAAELDRENRLKVLQYLNRIKCQSFITTNQIEDFGDLRFIDDYKMFHVERGEIDLTNVSPVTTK